MIVFADKDQEPEIFPPDPRKFNNLIDLYRRKRTTEPRKVGSCDVHDFFTKRNLKMEEELAKAKKKNSEAERPTWFEFLNDSSEEELREFALGLGSKIDHVKTKIESLKEIPMIDQNLDHCPFHPNTLNPMIPMDYNNLRFDPTDQCNLSENPPNLLTDLLMKEDDNDFYDFESLINIPPPPRPPLGCSFPPPMLPLPELAPPFVHDKPFSMSDFPSQMMEYNNFGFDSVELSCGDQCDLMIQPSPNSATELPMSEDWCNHDRDFNVQPLPVADSVLPPPQLQPELAPPFVHDEPFSMSDFPSRMMEYNNFGFDSVELSCGDQCDLMINQPSNPNSVTEMPMSEDLNDWCNYDRDFNVQPLPVADSVLPPPQPQPQPQPEAASVMHRNPFFVFD
ncbi:hypothetical protein Ccrd_019263 [Cynara cardunculus var. scolymus]|uniref:Uncharacterized protein n=1 Tax=Cynara cardunculus var. scolymus TaxID=59895 RepID=A0A103Y4R4_CYNCS|nr:hypothetical protein Ccrd_019263 [Cynara cardunculus var. scolymus]